ncbi:GATA-type zinc finger protein 1 [Austrofundulus limnaeus]|uniref:GATA-type zinc finger protein 1 n=1 Tax=Austrofundulus limnaeus TaxID=52670 RepID=A0A2I4AXY6_AUSLI|nr:PREDICTED: GATA-type zinc finger protein 1 [Austrofundulus limnaeus]
MTTGTTKEVTFIQENQSKAEHSALFYLFEEVSKLDPPVPASFLDANSPSEWLNEMSRKRRFSHGTEDEDECSLKGARGARKYSLSCMLSCNRVKSVSEETGDVSESDEPRCECSSPWKVLSLINLTCERLLHQKDAEEENSTLELSSTKSIQSTSAPAPPYGTERESDGDSLDCASEKITFVSPVDLRLDSQQLQFCVKDAGESCCVHQQPAEQTDPVTSEMQEDGSIVSLQTLCRDGEEFSISKQLDQECFSTKKNAFIPKKETQSSTCLKAEMTLSSGYSACAGQSKPPQTLDHNANITLSTKLPCDTQPPPQSAALPSSQAAPLVFTTAESCRSSSGQNEKFAASAPNRRQTPTVGSNPAADRSSGNICVTASPAELWTEQTKESDPPPQHRTKTRRKQPHPSRSADIQDPDFQGVTFRIDAELDDTREQCRLLITSKYSKKHCKAVRKPKLRARTSQKTLKTSSSDEENDLTANVAKNKVCASCCTRKTPMWRDAEDGTPLCNACGIRYKKYRVHCVFCWHIPRKEGNSNSCCLKCGNLVKPSSAQQKHSS